MGRKKERGKGKRNRGGEAGGRQGGNEPAQRTVGRWKCVELLNCVTLYRSLGLSCVLDWSNVSQSVIRGLVSGGSQSYILELAVMPWLLLPSASELMESWFEELYQVHGRWRYAEGAVNAEG